VHKLAVWSGRRESRICGCAITKDLYVPYTVRYIELNTYSTVHTLNKIDPPVYARSEKISKFQIFHDGFATCEV
jgi:hypothetical protein